MMHDSADGVLAQQQDDATDTAAYWWTHTSIAHEATPLPATAAAATLQCEQDIARDAQACAHDYVKQQQQQQTMTAAGHDADDAAADAAAVVAVAHALPWATRLCRHLPALRDAVVRMWCEQQSCTTQQEREAAVVGGNTSTTTTTTTTAPPPAQRDAVQLHIYTRFLRAALAGLYTVVTTTTQAAAAAATTSTATRHEHGANAAATTRLLSCCIDDLLCSMCAAALTSTTHDSDKEDEDEDDTHRRQRNDGSSSNKDATAWLAGMLSSPSSSQQQQHDEQTLSLLRYVHAFLSQTLQLRAHERAHYLPRLCRSAQQAVTRHVRTMTRTAQQSATTTAETTATTTAAAAHTVVAVLHGIVDGLTWHVCASTAATTARAAMANETTTTAGGRESGDEEGDGATRQRRYCQCVSLLLPVTSYAQASWLCDVLDALLQRQQHHAAHVRELAMRLLPLFTQHASTCLLLPRYVDVLARTLFVTASNNSSNNDDDGDGHTNAELTAASNTAWRACLCALQSHTPHNNDSNNSSAPLTWRLLLQQPLPTLLHMCTTLLSSSRSANDGSVHAVVAERGVANALRTRAYTAHKNAQQEQQQQEQEGAHADDTEPPKTDNNNNNDDNDDDATARLLFARYDAAFVALDAAVRCAATTMYDEADKMMSADGADDTTDASAVARQQQQLRLLHRYVSASLEHTLLLMLLDKCNGHDASARPTATATTTTTTTVAAGDVTAGELLAYCAHLTVTQRNTARLSHVRAALARFLGTTWADVLRYVQRSCVDVVVTRDKDKDSNTTMTTTTSAAAHMTRVGVVAALLLPPLRALGLDEHAWLLDEADVLVDGSDGGTGTNKTAAVVVVDAYASCAGGLPYPLGVLTTFMHELPRACYSRRVASLVGHAHGDALRFLLQCCGRGNGAADDDASPSRHDDDDSADAMVWLVAEALRVVFAQLGMSQTNSNSGKRSVDDATTPPPPPLLLLADDKCDGRHGCACGRNACARVDALLALAYGLRRLCSIDVSTLQLQLSSSASRAAATTTTMASDEADKNNNDGNNVTATSCDWRCGLRSRLVCDVTSSPSALQLLGRVVHVYRNIWQRALARVQQQQQQQQQAQSPSSSSRDVYDAVLLQQLQLTPVQTQQVTVGDDDNNKNNNSHTMSPAALATSVTHVLVWLRALSCDALDTHAVTAAKALLRSCTVHYGAHVCTRTLLDIRADMEHYTAYHDARSSSSSSSSSEDDALSALQAALVRDLTLLQQRVVAQTTMTTQDAPTATTATTTTATAATVQVDVDNTDEADKAPRDKDGDDDVTTSQQAQQLQQQQQQQQQTAAVASQQALRAYADVLCAALVVRACASPADAACAAHALRALVQTAAHATDLPLCNSNNNNSSNSNNNSSRATLTTGFVRRFVRAVAARLLCSSRATCMSLAVVLHIVIETVVLPYQQSFAATTTTSAATATASNASDEAAHTAPTTTMAATHAREQLTPHARDAAELLHNVVADVTRAVCALLQLRTTRADACAYAVTMSCRRVLRLLARYDAAWRNALTARLSAATTTTTTTTSPWLSLLQRVERPLLPDMTAPAASAYDLYTPPPAAPSPTTTTTITTPTTTTTATATTPQQTPLSTTATTTRRDWQRERREGNNSYASSSSQQRAGDRSGYTTQHKYTVAASTAAASHASGGSSRGGGTMTASSSSSWRRDSNNSASAVAAVSHTRTRDARAYKDDNDNNNSSRSYDSRRDDRHRRHTTTTATTRPAAAAAASNMRGSSDNNNNKSSSSSHYKRSREDDRRDGRYDDKDDDDGSTRDRHHRAYRSRHTERRSHH